MNLAWASPFNWNFHPLAVVSRWRDSQLQVRENDSGLTTSHFPRWLPRNLWARYHMNRWLDRMQICYGGSLIYSFKWKKNIYIDEK